MPIHTSELTLSGSTAFPVSDAMTLEAAKDCAEIEIDARLTGISDRHTDCQIPDS
jgi:hypothetical protein